MKEELDVEFSFSSDFNLWIADSAWRGVLISQELPKAYSFDLFYFQKPPKGRFLRVNKSTEYVYR